MMKYSLTSKDSLLFYVFEVCRASRVTKGVRIRSESDPIRIGFGQ